MDDLLDGVWEAFCPKIDNLFVECYSLPQPLQIRAVNKIGTNLANWRVNLEKFDSNFEQSDKKPVLGPQAKDASAKETRQVEDDDVGVDDILPGKPTHSDVDQQEIPDAKREVSQHVEVLFQPAEQGETSTSEDVEVTVIQRGRKTRKSNRTDQGASQTPTRSDVALQADATDKNVDDEMEVKVVRRGRKSRQASQRTTEVSPQPEVDSPVSSIVSRPRRSITAKKLPDDFVSGTRSRNKRTLEKTADELPDKRIKVKNEPGVSPAHVDIGQPKSTVRERRSKSKVLMTQTEDAGEKTSEKRQTPGRRKLRTVDPDKKDFDMSPVSKEKIETDPDPSRSVLCVTPQKTGKLLTPDTPLYKATKTLDREESADMPEGSDSIVQKTRDCHASSSHGEPDLLLTTESPMTTPEHYFPATAEELEAAMATQQKSKPSPLSPQKSSPPSSDSPQNLSGSAKSPAPGVFEPSCVEDEDDEEWSLEPLDDDSESEKRPAASKEQISEQDPQSAKGKKSARHGAKKSISPSRKAKSDIGKTKSKSREDEMDETVNTLKEDESDEIAEDEPKPSSSHELAESPSDGADNEMEDNDGVTEVFIDGVMTKDSNDTPKGNKVGIPQEILDGIPREIFDDNEAQGTPTVLTDKEFLAQLKEDGDLIQDAYQMEVGNAVNLDVTAAIHIKTEPQPEEGQPKKKKSRARKAPKKYKCPDCFRSFDEEYVLLAHTAIHQKGPIQCPHCPKKFVSRGGFMAHIRLHVGQNVAQCSYCDYKSGSQAMVRAHIRSKHERVLRHLCDICGAGFVTADRMKRHREAIHRSADSHMYRCDACVYCTHTPALLKRHVQNMHSKSGPVTCADCGLTLENKKSLAAHRREKCNGSLHAPDDQKTFHKCHLCQYVSYRAATLASHIKNKHAPKQEFVCNICGAVVHYKQSLIDHKKRHFSQKNYQCSMCPFLGVCAKDVKNHIRRMHMDASYKCEICDKTFKQLGHLTRHKVIHTGAKDFQCKICNFRCNVKGNLSKHVQLVHKKKEVIRAPIARLDEDSTINQSTLMTNEEGVPEGVVEEEHMVVEEENVLATGIIIQPEEVEAKVEEVEGGDTVYEVPESTATTTDGDAMPYQQVVYLNTDSVGHDVFDGQIVYVTNNS